VKKKKAGRKPRTVTVQRQEEVAKLYCQGVSIRKMASLLGVNQSTIQKDVKVVRKLWNEHHSNNIEAHISAELAKIDYLEQRAWLAYNKSEQQLDPDPRFLAAVDKCIQRRIDLLGMGKRSEETSGVDDRPIVAVVVQSRDQVQQVQQWSSIVEGKVIEDKTDGD
tara:strand:+ start:189 stop:683 length:495 start_codon:yes stop_codon:yes gene_type:complete